MKRFLITFCAHRAEDTGRMLRIASKVVEDLQASKMPCRLSMLPAPWQLAIEGEGEPDYIRRQILGNCDSARIAVCLQEEHSLFEK